MKSAVLCCLVLLTSCMKHVKPTPAVVSGQGYQIERMNDGGFLIVAANDAAYKAALKKLGCPCVMKYEGQLQLWTVRKDTR